MQRHGGSARWYLPHDTCANYHIRGGRIWTLGELSGSLSQFGPPQRSPRGSPVEAALIGWAGRKPVRGLGKSNGDMKFSTKQFTAGRHDDRRAAVRHASWLDHRHHPNSGCLWTTTSVTCVGPLVTEKRTEKNRARSRRTIH